MAKKRSTVREPGRIFRIKLPLYLRERRDVPSALLNPPKPRRITGRSVEIRPELLGFFPEVESEYGECIETFTKAYSPEQAFSRYVARCMGDSGERGEVYDLVLPKVLITEEQARPKDQRPKPKAKRKPEQDWFCVRVPYQFRGKYSLEPDYDTWFKPDPESDMTPEQTALRRVLLGALKRDWDGAMRVYHGTVGPTDKCPEGKFLKKYPWIEVVERGVVQDTLF